jgi:hypothetical protein
VVPDRVDAQPSTHAAVCARGLQWLRAPSSSSTSLATSARLLIAVSGKSSDADKAHVPPGDLGSGFARALAGGVDNMIGGCAGVTEAIDVLAVEQIQRNRLVGIELEAGWGRGRAPTGPDRRTLDRRAAATLRPVDGAAGAPRRRVPCARRCLRHRWQGKPYVVRRSVDATPRAAGVAFAATVEPGGRG